MTHRGPNVLRRTVHASTVKVTEGQKISVKEAIEAIMLPSANNIARQLARWDSDGDEAAFVRALSLGYDGVQMGTRFIATTECTAPTEYKQAILDAGEEDIVLTERLTGVPVAVIRTPHIEKMGTKAGPIGRWMLRGRKTKHWMRMIYSVQSLWKLKKSVRGSFSYKDYLQAGKSVAGVHAVESVAAIGTH